LRDYPLVLGNGGIKRGMAFITGTIQCKVKLIVHLDMVLNMKWSIISVVSQEGY